MTNEELTRRALAVVAGRRQKALTLADDALRAARSAIPQLAEVEQQQMEAGLAAARAGVAGAQQEKQAALARCAAALTGGVLLSLLCMGEAAVFYGRMFHWYGWGSLLLPALATLLPALVFALGSGWLLGQIRPWLVYVWMAGPFLCRALPLPDALGIWNGHFFSRYPLALGTLDPTFSMPAAVLIVQCILLAAGIVLLMVRPARSKR